MQRGWVLATVNEADQARAALEVCMALPSVVDHHTPSDVYSNISRHIHTHFASPVRTLQPRQSLVHHLEEAL